jgi:hypothetical protein
MNDGKKKKNEKGKHSIHSQRTTPHLRSGIHSYRKEKRKEDANLDEKEKERKLEQEIERERQR